MRKSDNIWGFLAWKRWLRGHVMETKGWIGVEREKFFLPLSPYKNRKIIYDESDWQGTSDGPEPGLSLRTAQLVCGICCCWTHSWRTRGLCWVIGHDDCALPPNLNGKGAKTGEGSAFLPCWWASWRAGDGPLQEIAASPRAWSCMAFLTFLQLCRRQLLTSPTTSLSIFNPDCSQICQFSVSLYGWWEENKPLHQDPFLSSRFRVDQRIFSFTSLWNVMSLQPDPTGQFWYPYKLNYFSGNNN